MTEPAIFQDIDAKLDGYTPGIDRAVRSLTIDDIDAMTEFYLRHRRAALDAAEAEIRSSAGSHQKALAQKNNHIVQLMAEKDAAEADKRQAVDAEQDRILGLIDDRFYGALSLRDEARKHGDTTGAMIHNEAVQQMAELRAEIRNQGDL